MNVHDLGVVALEFEEMANGYRALGHAELADKVLEASRAGLDAAFPNSAEETERAVQRLREVFQWLKEFERTL